MTLYERLARRPYDWLVRASDELAAQLVCAAETADRVERDSV